MFRVPQRFSIPGHERTGVLDDELDHCFGPTGLPRRPLDCVADHAESGNPTTGGSSRRVFFGSVADEVVTAAPCPVLTIHP